MAKILQFTSEPKEQAWNNIDKRIELSNHNGMEETQAKFYVTVPLSFGIPLDWAEDGTPFLPEENFKTLGEFVEAWGEETVLAMIDNHNHPNDIMENALHDIFAKNSVTPRMILIE